MPITKQISSRANLKQSTTGDFPLIPAQVVSNMYGPVTSTAGQTIINLTFAVSQTNTANFILAIDGKILSLGASNDYQFTNVQSNGTSSQITLNASIVAGLNIQAWYIGVAQPPVSATSLSTLQAQANLSTASIPKNYLLNGAFDFWQRGTSVTIANGVSTYQADRWYVKNSLGTNGVITFSQVAGSLNGSKFGAQVQITTAPTAAQTNGTELYQTLENLSFLELYSQNACFSANIKALGNVNQVGLQFMSNTSEAKVTTTIGSEVTVAVNTSGFTLGQIVNQALGSAMTTSGVVGVRIRITGVSSGNLYDLNNGFIVEQAMLNLGSTAANFSRAGRHPSSELAMCQRYYTKTYDLTVAPASITAVGALNSSISPASGANQCVAQWSFSSRMRVSPTTVTFYHPTTGATGSWGDNVNNPINVAVQTQGQSNLTVINSGSVSASGKFVYGHVTADAEI